MTLSKLPAEAVGATLRWTPADLPDLTGLTVLVTGATAGLGEATTIALSTRGAHVVLATRNAEKTTAVMDRIRQRHPEASLEHLSVDLADLASVRSAAEAFLTAHASVDRIVANAGIMAPPLQRTADGFEMQLGVNHLGHFALVGLLLPALLAADGARVVTVSSGAHKVGRIDLTDLNWDRERYEKWPAYGRSKLANLLFTSELQRRLEAAPADAVSVAAHPGYAATDLQTTGPTAQGGISGRINGIMLRAVNAVVAQSASQGALPQLFATAAPDVPGGSYWGPDGPGEVRGSPGPAARSGRAQDPVMARALWEASEELTGVHYDLPAA